MRLTRSAPDYNWTTRPIVLRLFQQVIVEEDVLIMVGVRGVNRWCGTRKHSTFTCFAEYLHSATFFSFFQKSYPSVPKIYQIFTCSNLCCLLSIQNFLLSNYNLTIGLTSNFSEFFSIVRIFFLDALCKQLLLQMCETFTIFYHNLHLW
jgi:hypothetical protein